MQAWIAQRGVQWGARRTVAVCWCVFDDDERKAWGVRFVEKDADGYCKHLDRENHLCGIWQQRSRTCRGYDCNRDFLLQVAVRNRFGNIAELVRLAATAYIPKETFIRIPPAAD